MTTKKAYCFSCERFTKRAPSRTLLLEERLLPARDKSIYNVLESCLAESPSPLCEDCCLSVISSVREAQRLRQPRTVVKTAILSNMVSYQYLHKGNDPTGSDSVTGASNLTKLHLTGSSSMNSLASLDDTQSVADESQANWFLDPCYATGNYAPGKSFYASVLNKHLTTEQSNSTSTLTEDLVSLGSVDMSIQGSIESNYWDQQSETM